MNSINRNNSLRKTVFTFWDNQKLAGLLTVDFIKSAHYGANQDFVQATCAALMPKVGYIRPETVSVYFRSYKVKVKRTLDSIGNI